VRRVVILPSSKIMISYTLPIFPFSGKFATSKLKVGATSPISFSPPKFSNSLSKAIIVLG